MLPAACSRLIALLVTVLHFVPIASQQLHHRIMLCSALPPLQLQSPKRKQKLSAAADQLSCALFGIANTVTALFFAIEKSTKASARSKPVPINYIHLLRSANSWLALPIASGALFTPSYSIVGLCGVQGLVEGGALERPAWLNLAVHVINSVVAWLDLVIGERESAGDGCKEPPFERTFNGLVAGAWKVAVMLV